MQEDEDKVYFLNDEMGADFDKIKRGSEFLYRRCGTDGSGFDEYEVAPRIYGNRRDHDTGNNLPCGRTVRINKNSAERFLPSRSLKFCCIQAGNMIS